MAKKVLIFSTAYLPMIGGAEIAVKEITDRLGGYDFDLITARHSRKFPKFERVGRINVYRAGLGWSFFDKLFLPLSGCLEAAKLHQQNSYDLVWSIMASQASVAAAFFKKRYPTTKLLLTLQEGDEEEHLKRYVLGINFLYGLLIKPWHLLVFKRADAVTAISQDLKQRALRNRFRGIVEVIPNGVDINNFTRSISEFELNELRNKLGKKVNDKFIIHTGRSVLKNALDDIIRALKLLPDNIKFLVLGTGPDDEKLKRFARDLGVNERVISLGLVSHQEMVKYLKISDVFVRPSLSEGLGNSFLEAMVAGLPIIGTPVGGIPDFLKNQETGLFCKVKDPADVAEKVKMLLGDEALRKKLIESGRRLVAQNYNWDDIAPKMENIFNQLVN